jgi:nitrite reductase/ring-hydroxylating ferredoxin subunit
MQERVMEPGATLERGFSGLPIPFGWFAVALSDELAEGEIRTLHYFGTEFVAWRGRDGEVRAIDPICPHLGAHLGVNSEVVGNDLRCPYHHWSFNGEGAVTAIPYTKVIPPRLKKGCTRNWPVTEADGVIYVWYHPEGEAPKWEVERIGKAPEGGTWVLSETRQWTIKVHIQEITENSQDHAHFASVHGVPGAPSAEFRIDGWVRRNVVEAEMNTPRGLMHGKIDNLAVGPGQTLVEFSDVTNVLLAQECTPIDSETTRVRWQLYHPAGISDGKMRVTKARMRDLAKQIEQDIPIWNAKVYKPKPLLVEGDGPIIAYRDQYARFYA